MAKLARTINAISLDAVAVSLVWQHIFCISFTGRLPTLAQNFALGLTVWLIYCTDRLLDAARVNANAKVTYRHEFHLRHRRALTIIWMFLLVIDAAVVCLGIDGQILVLGIGLAAGVLFYGAGVHFSATPLRRIPKEVQVGFLFACGVSLVTWPSVVASPASMISLLTTLGLASILFTCNCVFVAACELETDLAQGFDSLPRQWLQRDRASVGTSLMVSTIALGFVSLMFGWFEIVPWTAGVTLAISSTFLSVLSIAQFSNQVMFAPTNQSANRLQPIGQAGFTGKSQPAGRSLIVRGFSGKLTAGLVADSVLFLPPLLCVPWLS